MIGKVIKSKFDSDATLNGIFGGRVFPYLAAQGASAPYAVYDVFRGQPPRRGLCEADRGGYNLQRLSRCCRRRALRLSKNERHRGWCKCPELCV